jgi:hypothetical protein
MATVVATRAGGPAVADVAGLSAGEEELDGGGSATRSPFSGPPVVMADMISVERAVKARRGASPLSPSGPGDR